MEILFVLKVLQNMLGLTKKIYLWSKQFKGLTKYAKFGQAYSTCSGNMWKYVRLDHTCKPNIPEILNSVCMRSLCKGSIAPLYAWAMLTLA